MISPKTTIIIESNTELEQFAAQQINEELALQGASQLVVQPARGARLSDCIFIGSPDGQWGKRFLKDRQGRLTPEMAAEGYFLDADSAAVVIVAASEKGRFYGVMTLLQLMRQARGGILIPGGTIHDYPAMRIRGITDDVSRGQVSTVDNFKKIIRFLARYKMNAYSPYLEDMFAFKNHPLIGKGRGALTSDEVKEIDAYARKFYIDLIPTFQTLGHWENILYIPAYVSYAEYPGGRTLNVSDARVYDLLGEMIGELCAAFSSPYFNMAADETRDVGLGANKERVAQVGLASVLAAHYNRVAEIIRAHGKKPMIYGDIILKNPEILRMIPKDFTIIDWDYDPRYSYGTPKVFKDAGFPFVVSPAVRNYAGPFLDLFNSFENIQRFNKAGHEIGAEGVLVSSWNDYGGEALREFNYYGYAWGAECAWRPEGANADEFNRLFFRDFFGSDENAVIQTVFAILSSPANHYSWHELWRHPMLPFLPPTPTKGHSPNIMERLQSIKSTMPLVMLLLEQGREHIMRNTGYLDYLQFVAELNLWFAEKVETGEEVSASCKMAPMVGNKDSLARVIVARCSQVLDGLARLRDKFTELWLRTNKPEGLELLQSRYDRQAAYWKEKIAEVERGEFQVDPGLESGWIYHPEAKSATGELTRVQHAYFRKGIVLPSGIRSAKLQLIGDTYVKLWVNGHSVGEVVARRSNSLNTEMQRVRVFDVLPFLRDSANVICAEAQDFSLVGSAGVNLYGEVQPAGGSAMKILSDETWKVALAPAEGWLTVQFDDSRWINAVKKPYPYTIVRPMFSRSMASWIER